MTEVGNIRLTERRPRTCRLRRDDLDFLLAHHRPHVDIEFTGERHRYRLTPRGYAGVIVTPNCRFVLRPKVALADLLFLLNPDDDVLMAPDVGDGRVGGLFELFAGRLARLLNERAAAGLHRGYAEQTAELPFVRGRLNVSRQVRDSATARRDRLHCRFDELTADVACNRLVRAAAEQVAQSPLLDEQVRAAVRHALVGLAEVGVEPATPEAFAHALADPATAAYRPVLELCQLLCSAATPGSITGQFPTSSFLIELEHLFERYVTRGLVRHFAGSPIEIAVQPRISLPEDSSTRPDLSLRPDVVLRADGRAAAVIDVKWKRLADAPEPADLHQILAYASALRCEHVALVYPGRRSRCRTYQIPGGPVRLALHTLRVGGPRLKCRRSLERFARALSEFPGEIRVKATSSRPEDLRNRAPAA
ncbi:MAG: McrC family protein [Gemmataceae bacterium]